jgi:hypothetical protein
MATVNSVTLTTTAGTLGVTTYNDVTGVYVVPKVAAGTGGAHNVFTCSGMTLRVVYLDATNSSTTASVGISGLQEIHFGESWQNYTTRGLRDR